MKPAIRFMSTDDIPAVVAADRRILGQTLGEVTLKAELTENPFANYFVMLDEETDEFLGHVGLWVDPPLAQIINVYVVPERQKAGLGRFLMEFVIAFLRERGCNTLTLEVRPSNGWAIGFYKSLGFEKVSVRKYYYEDGEDADLMLLSI
jgi:ribosomal-protein-alanine N-acetyltransferase